MRTPRVLRNRHLRERKAERSRGLLRKMVAQFREGMGAISIPFPPRPTHCSLCEAPLQAVHSRVEDGARVSLQCKTPDCFQFGKSQ